MQKILVQACCGPCAIAVFDQGWDKEFETLEIFFNGDNFDTYAEYLKRRRALKTVTRHYTGINLRCADRYMPVEFMSCEHCIEYRLRRTAEVAGIMGFDCFGTTLTVSPHKNTDTVNAIGKKVAAETGMPFHVADLKKRGGFQRTVEISKELGLYRQNYCGCKRSALK
jgi:predicted adenine nucleotide alpha hydrolase (AANH) superfamily ATPase